MQNEVKLKRSAINEDLEATDIPLTVHGGEIGAVRELSGVVQDSHLALDIDVSTSGTVQGSLEGLKVCRRHLLVL